MGRIFPSLYCEVPSRSCSSTYPVFSVFNHNLAPRRMMSTIASISRVFAIDIDLQAFQCLTPVSMLPPDHLIRCLNKVPTRAGISCQHSTGASRVAMCALAKRTDSSASSTRDFGSHNPTLSSAVLRKNVLDPENVTNNLKAYFPSFDKRYKKFS